MGNPLVRITVGAVLILIAAIFIYVRYGRPVTNETVNNSVEATAPLVNDNTPRFDNSSADNTPGNTTSNNQEVLALPIDEFKPRITQKHFGDFISPATSPIQGERFTGFHTAVDVEYTDTEEDVSVYALSDGKVVLSRTASGYGGVFVIQFSFKGQNYTAIYGHIRPSTLPASGSSVTKGQKLAVLGKGNTSETDNERKHLHFGIHKGTEVNISGYVQNELDLAGWVDPLSLYL